MFSIWVALIISLLVRSIKMRPGGCAGTKRTDSMEDRIADLNAQFTFMIYESISRSLFQVWLVIFILSVFNVRASI